MVFTGQQACFRYVSIDPDREIHEHKIVFIFLHTNLNMCFGCSKEPSHWDGSFVYPQHMFWMTNKENSFPIRFPIWRPEVSYNTFLSNFYPLGNFS